MLQQLDSAMLRRAAPSIFATEPWNGVSAKYSFISTSAIVDRLHDEDMVPISARQSRTRIEGKEGFTRHELRFVQANMFNSGTPVVGGTYPTVILTNSHDTGTSFAIDAGLYRLVCSNGMMVPSSLAQSCRVKHIGNIDDVIEGVFNVVDEMKELPALIERYQGTILNRGQQLAFASAASELRTSTLPISTAQLLQPTRRDDVGTDLWSTLNVVQEHLTKGGLQSRSATGRRMRTRAMTDISEDQKLNRALFVLAEKLQETL